MADNTGSRRSHRNRRNRSGNSRNAADVKAVSAEKPVTDRDVRENPGTPDSGAEKELKETQTAEKELSQKVLEAASSDTAEAVPEPGGCRQGIRRGRASGSGSGRNRCCSCG